MHPSLYSSYFFMHFKISSRHLYTSALNPSTCISLTRARYLFRFYLFWGQLFIKENTQIYVYLSMTFEKKAHMWNSNPYRNTACCHHSRKFPCFFPFPQWQQLLRFSPHHELLWSVLEKPYKWNFYVHFHVRFLSLSIKFLRFIYNVVCINSLFPFYFWVVLHSRNIHSFVYLLYFRHLDYFKLLAILNALAIIIILY